MCECVRALRFMKMGFSLLAKPVQSKITQKTLFFVSTFTSHFPFPLLPITWQVLIHARNIFWDTNKKGISYFRGALFVEHKEKKIEKTVCVCVHIVSTRSPYTRFKISWTLFSFFFRLNWIIGIIYLNVVSKHTHTNKRAVTRGNECIV